MDAASNNKTLSSWFFPLTAAVNLFADIVILFAVIIHLDFVHASDALFQFVAFGFSIVEFVAAVLLVGITVFTGIIRSKFQIPSKITFGTFIYHTIVMVATVFIQYFYDMSYLAFPYQMLAIIPLITTVLSLVFFFMDWHSGKSEPKGQSKSRQSRKGSTFSAVTDTAFSDYIDDLSPAPKPSAKTKVQDAYRKVRRKRPAFRPRNLKLPSSSAKSANKPPIDKSRDYSNDVQDLFSETDPAFRQGGSILDSILGERPSEEKEQSKPKKADTTRSYMEEFPDIPDEDKKGSVFEKHSNAGKLSSDDASEALKNHKM